jgi:hypothetical protein
MNATPSRARFAWLRPAFTIASLLALAALPAIAEEPARSATEAGTDSLRREALDLRAAGAGWHGAESTSPIAAPRSPDVPGSPLGGNAPTPRTPIVFGPAAGDAQQEAAALASQLRRDELILFDGARFDPLADGEPRLEHVVPQAPSYDDLDATAPRHAVVQLSTRPGPRERAALAEEGLDVLAYVPNNAYLVRGDGVALSRAARLAGVRWVGRYRPGYKLDRELGRLAAGKVVLRSPLTRGGEPLVLDLLLTPSASAGAVAEAIDAATEGIEILAAWEGRRTGPGLITLAVTESRLGLDVAALANVEEVLTIEPRGEIRLHNDDAVWIGQSYDTFAQQDYSLSAPVWNQGLMGGGEIIGLLDTGVDPDTCWLEDTAGLPPVTQIPPSGDGAGPLSVDLSRRKIVAYNLLSSFQASAEAYDLAVGEAHGTWAAVSAVGDNPARLADESDPSKTHHDFADGMAPAAKLVVQDFSDSQGNIVGLGRPDYLVVDDIFVQMYDAGARIATNSWGVAGNQYDTLAFFTDRMAWEYPDFLIIFSAGNDGPYAGTIDSPATAKSVVTVGASDAKLEFFDDLDPENVWEFSGRGPTSDGRTKPDVMMSGHKLVTGDSDGGEFGQTCDTVEANGTSFAAPLVAGFAALTRQYYREGFYPSGARDANDGFAPSAALVKASLIAGARNMQGSAGQDYGACLIDTCDTVVGFCSTSFLECQDDADCQVCELDASLKCEVDRDCDLTLVSDDAPAYDQGFGRVLLDDVLYFAGDPRGLAVWDVPRTDGLATGESWRSEFYVESGSEPLQVVLTWPDPPALVASPSYLVNDLDLKVTAPDGTVYWGNAWSERDRSPFTIETTVPGVRPGDDPDPVELVRLDTANLETGRWTVEVVGESVPGSPWIDGGERQDFAVVATGAVSSDTGSIAFGSQRFACSGDVDVEVRDANASSPLTVTLTTGSGDSETLSLDDQGGGVFRGSLPLTAGAPIAGSSGTLEVVDGDTLQATYDDGAPVGSPTAFARAACVDALSTGPVTVAGGCDGDEILDAGEQADLSVPLVNATLGDLEGVSARLVSRDERLFVVADEATYGALPAGASADPTTPFQVSLRDGVAPRTTLDLELVVSSTSWTRTRSVPFSIVVEADEVVSSGTWTEDFESAAFECYDGDPPPTPGSWYYFDVNDDCTTAEDSWQIGNCFGTRRALLPSCQGQLLSDQTQTAHRLVSPKIETGDEGSTTVIDAVRFVEDYDFRINEDGQPCDWVKVEIFTNRDGRLSPTGYWRDVSAQGDADDVTLEPTTIAEWSIAPVPDASVFQLIFQAAWRSPESPATTCFSSQGDEFSWRVDDVEVDWQNVALEDDATPSCPPGCTAPGTPVEVTTAAAGTDTVVVGWNAVPDAHHYDVYRSSDGGEALFVGRATAPDTAFVDTPSGDGPWTYEVEAVDASGLCASPRSAPTSFAGSLGCVAPPAAPTNLEASDDALATCSATLTWDAVSPPCGGAVSYRVYRSLAEDFEPGPENLLVETSGTSWVDDALTSGWDADGEPLGDEYHYAVRAVEDVTGQLSPAARAAVRAGGTRQPGTWIDDAGDTGVVKVRFETVLDETDSDAGWSRSPVAVTHNGSWSYWSDTDPLGTGRYDALSCTSIVSPEVRLDPVAAPELSIWINYEIEYLWDGVVVELSADGGPFSPITPVGGYPGTFAETVAPPCQGAGGGTGDWINGCDYPPTQGCITGPEFGGLSGWERYAFDLTAWAGSDVRFRINLSTDCGTNGGTVVDEMTIAGALLPSECASGSCLPAPVFAGVASAEDLDPAVVDGVELTWGTVESWGGGGPGTFEVYRDGELVATLPDGTSSWVDADAVANQPHTYQVIARGGSGCALPSASIARLVATDCGDLPASTIDAAELSVRLSPNGTAVVLRSAPLPGETSYRFSWSDAPQTVAGSPTFIPSSVPEARHEVGQDGLTYFYLVEDERPDACP